jgi:hypothetical protein
MKYKPKSKNKENIKPRESYNLKRENTNIASI